MIPLVGSRSNDDRNSSESVRDAHDRLLLAIDSAEIGTFYCPMPMGQIYWNARCKEHFWLDENTTIDFELFYSIIHHDDRDRTRAAVTAAVSEGVPYDIEYRTVSPSGEVRWLRAKGGTRFDPVGNELRFDGITIDISKQKRLETDLAKLMERERFQKLEAQAANSMKDTFIATVSHELRTPLTSILSWVNVLEHSERPPREMEGLAVIKRNVQTQTKLVDDLLDISNFSFDKFSIEKANFSISQCLIEELDQIRPLAQEKDIRLSHCIDPDLGVNGDEARIRQVFENLLDNALKYTDRHGEINVATSVIDDDVKIVINDTGLGINKDQLSAIFEPFFQVDGSKTRRHGGLGLGLAIARSIVNMHAGELQADSAGLGEGATFTVILPVERPAFKPVEEGVVSSRNSDTAPRFQGKTVLVIDDDREVLEALAMNLEFAGLRVFTAESAAQARARLDLHGVDVIFSDISMPYENGYQLVSKLRAGGNNTPAVAVTAHVRDEDRREARNAGFNEHVGKPVELETLLAMVTKLTMSGRENWSTEAASRS